MIKFVQVVIRAVINGSYSPYLSYIFIYHSHTLPSLSSIQGWKKYMKKNINTALQDGVEHASTACAKLPTCMNAREAQHNPLDNMCSRQQIRGKCGRGGEGRGETREG